MPLDSDHTRLCHILDAAREVVGYVEGLPREAFNSQRPLQHSVVRCIEIMGEAALRLSPEFRNASPDIPWQDMIGMPNRLIHAYFDLDLDLLWITASQEIPCIIPRLTALLSEQ